MATRVLWLLLALACGCGDDVAIEEPTGGSGGGGGAGGAAPCPAGTVPEDDDCVAAGVKSCAPGFEPNQRGGCRAILPSEACAPGHLALPGETRCRAVGEPCGEAPWGLIPVDETTHYVDASYPGTDSDGSAAKPWTTIQQAINAATDQVAVAAGTYPEALITGGKPVRIWGRCPELVRVVADSPWEAVAFNAPGTEVHNITLSGEIGVGAYYAGDALLEDVWIHATTLDGVLTIGEDIMPTHLILRDSLVEEVAGIALVMVHTDATIERSVIRDVGGSSEQGAGRGIHLEDDVTLAGVPELVVRESIVERAREVGVVLYDASLSLEASLVRDVAAADTGRHGVGVAVQRTVKPATSVISGSLIERNITFGLSVVNAEVSVTGTTIEDVQVQESDARFGDALAVVSTMSGTLVTIEDSRLASAGRAGIGCFSAAVTLSGTALECNAFHLDGEAIYGAFSFDDLGSNACWCGDEPTICKVLSAGIEPPEVLR